MAGVLHGSGSAGLGQGKVTCLRRWIGIRRCVDDFFSVRCRAFFVLR
jgi:hypothetical protein